MNIARISSKGQITIPSEIRKQMNLKEGDKIAFINEGGKIYFVNSNQLAIAQFQEGMVGAAKKSGLNTEQDVVDYVNEIRKELWENGE